MNFQIFPQQFKLKIIHKSNHPLCYIKRKMILNKKKLYINCVFDSNVIYEIQCCGSQITWIAYKWHIQINFEFLCKKKYIKDKYNCLRAISKTIVWVASQQKRCFPTSHIKLVASQQKKCIQSSPIQYFLEEHLFKGDVALNEKKALYFIG